MKREYTCSVSVYLFGDALNPASMSAILGVGSSRSRLKGEQRTIRTKHVVTAKTGVWVLEVRSESDDLSPLVEQLASQLGDLSSAMAKIEGIEDAFVDVFVATDANEDGGGTCEFRLSETSVKALARLNLPVQFTIAVVRE